MVAVIDLVAVTVWIKEPNPMTVVSKCSQYLSWNNMHCNISQEIGNTNTVDICNETFAEIPLCTPHSTSKRAANRCEPNFNKFFWWPRGRKSSIKKVYKLRSGSREHFDPNSFVWRVVHQSNSAGTQWQMHELSANEIWEIHFYIYDEILQILRNYFTVVYIALEVFFLF